MNMHSSTAAVEPSRDNFFVPPNIPFPPDHVLREWLIAAKAGIGGAKNQIVLRFGRWAFSLCAKKYRWMHQDDFADVWCAALEGLLKAINQFDFAEYDALDKRRPPLARWFMGHARWWVHGEISAELKRLAYNGLAGEGEADRYVWSHRWLLNPFDPRVQRVIIAAVRASGCSEEAAHRQIAIDAVVQDVGCKPETARRALERLSLGFFGLEDLDLPDDYFFTDAYDLRVSQGFMPKFLKDVLAAGPRTAAKMIRDKIGCDAKTARQILKRLRAEMAEPDDNQININRHKFWACDSVGLMPGFNEKSRKGSDDDDDDDGGCAIGGNVVQFEKKLNEVWAGSGHSGAADSAPTMDDRFGEEDDEPTQVVLFAEYEKRQRRLASYVPREKLGYKKPAWTRQVRRAA